MGNLRATSKCDKRLNSLVVFFFEKFCNVSVMSIVSCIEICY